MIDLAENDDQAEIARTAAKVLAEAGSSPQAAQDLWRRCADLGWLGLAVPEHLGGVGYGVVEQVVLFREIGRALTVGPYLAAALAAQVAVAAAAGDTLASILDGSTPVALAEPAGTPGLWRIWSDGCVPRWVLLVDPSSACRLVEAGRVQTVEVAATIDPAYRLHTVRIDADAGVLAVAPDGASIARSGALLVAAMLVGLAERTRDLSARYAVDRVQYGRRIGSFQAVKHRCADMAVRADAAWAQTCLAAVELGARRDEAAFDVTAALVVASSAALANARDNIQNHGAIGFTDEHAAHRYLKRAHVLGVQFGTPERHREQLLAAASPW